MSQLTDVLDMQKSLPPSYAMFRHSQPLAGLLETELDRVARFMGIFPTQTADQASGNPNFDTVNLLWWHLLLMLKRHLYIMHPSEILIPAKVMVDMLKHQTSSGPFHIHFYALNAITFLELTDIPEFETDAWNGISDLLSALDRRRSVPTVPSSRPQSPKTTNGKVAGESSSSGPVYLHANATPGWDEAIRALISRKQRKGSQLPRRGSAHESNQVKSPGAHANSTSPITANAPTTEAGRSLQQLADLAEKVGGGDAGQDVPAAGAGLSGGTDGKAATGEPVVIDFSLLTRHGYFSALA